MRMIHPVASLLCLACLVAGVTLGCVKTDAVALGGETYPARPGDHPIDMYLDNDAFSVEVLKGAGRPLDPATIPPGAFRVGRIDVSGAPMAGWDAVFREARIKARKLGGDAVHVGRVQRRTGYSTGDAKDVQLTVLRYRD